MPLQETSGAASYDAFGGGVPVVPQYIEDVFSTYLYAGNDSTQTITNGIDLSTKGGLVWGKSRTNAANHFWTDTVRGNTKVLYSDLANAQGTSSVTVTGFNANGFGLGAGDIVGCNSSGQNYASWTFRKQPKFFDIVTATATSGSDLTVNHNLGVVPSCVFIKVTSTTGDWFVLHSSIGTNKYLILDSTSAAATYSGGGTTNWSATSTTLTIPSGYFYTGTTQVVLYLFASNAGGFGLTGTDNVISCGSYTGSGAAGKTVTLNYEPQWLLIKRSDGITQWNAFDIMRGLTGDNSNGSKGALPSNYASTESAGFDAPYVTPTGFGLASSNANYNAAGGTYIYIAIRRPMKTPTSGYQVFNAITRTGTGAATSYTGVGFTPDLVATYPRTIVGNNGYKEWFSRITGSQNYLRLGEASAEFNNTASLTSFDMNGVSIGSFIQMNSSGDNFVDHHFKRAPGFMTEVCYAGTGSGAKVVSHDLGVQPELIIVKARNASGSPNAQWWVGSKYLDNAVNPTLKMDMPDPAYAAMFLDGGWDSGYATTTNFTLSSNQNLGLNYIARLFASLPGISKVGSYAGNGSSQTINCGFTGGARYVLIKRINGTGSWWVFDTVRGMVSSNDRRIALETQADVEYNNNWVYTTTGGFQVVTSTVDVNASGSNYLYLAIA